MAEEWLPARCKARGCDLGNSLIVESGGGWGGFGGEGGIRTPDTVARMPDFESGAFDHSATSPRLLAQGQKAAHSNQNFVAVPGALTCRLRQCGVIAGVKMSISSGVGLVFHCI